VTGRPRDWCLLLPPLKEKSSPTTSVLLQPSPLPPPTPPTVRHLSCSTAPSSPDAPPPPLRTFYNRQCHQSSPTAVVTAATPPQSLNRNLDRVTTTTIRTKPLSGEVAPPLTSTTTSRLYHRLLSTAVAPIQSRIQVPWAMAFSNPRRKEYVSSIRDSKIDIAPKTGPD
jgi:hypothetical protein